MWWAHLLPEDACLITQNQITYVSKGTCIKLQTSRKKWGNNLGSIRSMPTNWGFLKNICLFVALNCCNITVRTGAEIEEEMTMGLDTKILKQLHQKSQNADTKIATGKLGLENNHRMTHEYQNTYQGQAPILHLKFLYIVYLKLALIKLKRNTYKLNW